MIKFKNGQLIRPVTKEYYDLILEELSAAKLPEERIEDQFILSLKARIENEMSTEQFNKLYKNECLGVKFNYTKCLENGYETETLYVDFIRKAFDWQDEELTTQFTIEFVLYKSDYFDYMPLEKAIETLEQSDIPEYDYLNTTAFMEKLNDEQKKIINEVESLVCSYIIDKRGHVDYEAKTKLYEAGIKITPGETDSFGWLTGCVHTKKGIVVFG